MFNALFVHKYEDGKTSPPLTQLALDDLPTGDVVFSLEYSTVN